MEDRRTVEVVDVTARHQIESHEKECAVRYAGIRRDYEITNHSLEITNSSLERINLKLDQFKSLIFISVIGFFVSLTVVFAVNLWNSQDRFTGKQADTLSERITELEKRK